MAREDYPEEELTFLPNGKEAWQDEHGFIVRIDKSDWDKKYKGTDSEEDWEEDEDDPQKMVISHYYLVDIETNETINDLKLLSEYYEIDEVDLERSM
tara:strand:+ start:22 stop:312 length:291 start_codon:yes stop_codon:yes gene_type:complete